MLKLDKDPAFMFVQSPEKLKQHKLQLLHKHQSVMIKNARPKSIITSFFNRGEEEETPIGRSAEL